jgi:hypothetical protein
MLKLLKKFFLDEQENAIYLDNPRKQGVYTVFAFCADCNKVQPMSTSCQCLVCGSRAIAVKIGSRFVDSKIKK